MLALPAVIGAGPLYLHLPFPSMVQRKGGTPQESCLGSDKTLSLRLPSLSIGTPCAIASPAPSTLRFDVAPRLTKRPTRGIFVAHPNGHTVTLLCSGDTAPRPTSIIDSPLRRAVGPSPPRLEGPGSSATLPSLSALSSLNSLLLSSRILAQFNPPRRASESRRSQR